MADPVTTVDAYVAALPEQVRPVMEGLRRSIRAVVPEIGETISYAMPTFTLDDQPLLHLAAWKQHIGLYPLPAVDPEFDAAVAPWRGTKDTMKLPYSRPVPRELVARVVQALVERRRG